ncbi:MAG: hypothetical protein R3D29_06675 [Nitratireductor sp.]
MYGVLGEQLRIRRPCGRALRFENVAGSSHVDFLFGDANANTVSGNSGADWLYGGGGDDLMNGGAGADLMFSRPVPTS